MEKQQTKRLAQKVATLLLILVSTRLPAQTFTKPAIIQPPTLVNAAKKTDILTAERLDIPIPRNINDTLIQSVISSVNPRPRIEQYFSKDFDSFKDTAKLVYVVPKNVFRPKVPNLLRIAWGSDANSGDRSAPLDNSLGCSTDNHIISLTNNYIQYWNNYSLEFTSDLGSFIDNQMPSPCDPKVYFDSSVNRFIIFFQRCDDAYNKSEILIGFSITSNPKDGWNFYKLSGNPLKKSQNWFDYPKIGISKDGLFISGNIFIGGNKGLAQTVVYQIDKNLGFNGQTIKYRVWYDIADSPFTIMPVNYASNGVSENGIYLLSTTWRNPADYIKLYDITGDIYNSNSTMNFYKVKTTQYNFFATAAQRDGAISNTNVISRSIDNGDIRIQDAILAKDKIYYVFTSGDNRNFSRINYNVLNVPTLENISSLIGDELNYSYAYPSLQMFSDDNEQPKILLQYNATSNLTYPEIRCTTCDDQGGCAPELVVKSGESAITNYDRWGDYSTVTKNRLSKHELWLASSYGKKDGRQTYLAKMVAVDAPITARDTIISNKLFPTTSVNFNLTDKADIQVILRSDNMTKTIYDGKAEKGENLFEVFTHDLKKGDYTIDVVKKSTQKTLNSTSFNSQ